MPAHVFNIMPSTTYLFLLVLFLVASLVVVLTLPLSWGYRSLLLAALIVYGGQLIWRQGLLKGDGAILALEITTDGDWRVTTRTQKQIMTLCGDSTITHLVSILRFQCAGKLLPLSCTLFRDSLRADEYRQLSILLRHA